MEKITYGAPGLVDWAAQIKVGAARVRVHFTGGALTSLGITPAEYSTTNPFIQKVIEGSAYYKDGRIIFMRRAEVANNQDSKPKRKGVSKSAAIAPQPTVEAEESVTDEDEILRYAEPKEVEVSCLPEAQAYLQENFGVPSRKTRSCELAQQAAAEHGIKFVGAKFGAGTTNQDSGEEESEED